MMGRYVLIEKMIEMQQNTMVKKVKVSKTYYCPLPAAAYCCWHGCAVGMRPNSSLWAEL
jgi:hypothetical protein